MRYFVACPACGKLSTDSEGWVFVETNVEEWSFEVADGFVNYSIMRHLDTEYQHVEHECGFEVENYSPDDLLIGIENDTIVEWGAYFDEHPDALENVARLNNLKVKEGEG